MHNIPSSRPHAVKEAQSKQQSQQSQKARNRQQQHFTRLGRGKPSKKGKKDCFQVHRGGPICPPDSACLKKELCPGRGMCLCLGLGLCHCLCLCSCLCP